MSVLPWTAPRGIPLPVESPAPAGNDVASAGMFYTIQCQKPAPPVGASGSCTSSAKLLVPAGGFFHSSAGDLPSPVHPMMFPAFFCSMVPPLLKSVLVNVNGAADAVPADASSSAALIPMMFRKVRSLRGPGFWELRGQT